MIDTLTTLQWREPGWLALAVVPLLFAGWRRRRRLRLQRYAEPALWPWAASAGEAGPASRWRAGLHGLAWLLLALAAAGPRTPLEIHDGEPAQRHQLTVMTVVDVSASMRAADIAPDRLTRARLELGDWLPRLRGERVGVIVYAGQAGLLLPPTDDPALVARALDQIDPRLIEARGSHLAAALDLARTGLRDAPGQAKAVLLVTDAEAGSADAAAQRAAERLTEARIPLFVLAVGSEAGAPIPLPEGGWAEQAGVQVQSRLDAGPYRAWARADGGRLVEVADGNGDWSALHDRGLAALPGDPVAADRARAWREHFAWFLAPALALLLALTLPRRAAAGAAALALAAFVAPSPASADEAAAWRAWQQKHYGSAQTLYLRVGGYGGQMGAGAAAWRQADYGGAARHFGEALLLASDLATRADALYNLGNAHYALGRYAVAVAAFETVLAWRPGDARARTNLEWARQRLQRQRSREPTPSDLRARRGMLAEGRIQLDVDPLWRPDEARSDPSGVLVDRRRETTAAAAATPQTRARPRIAVDAALAASGLKKLDRLSDRPEVMLGNVLRQDAQPDDMERAPW